MLSEIILVLLVITLVAATVTDLRKRIIPNLFTLPMAGLLSITRILTGELEYFIGLVPATLFFLIYLINPNGIGAGDIKLLAVVGLALGLAPTISIIFWMCLVFLLIAITTKFIDKTVHSLPMAPLIMLGFIVTSILMG